MALDKSKLEKELIKFFDNEAADFATSSKIMADAIYEYMKDVHIKFVPAVGINPAGSPPPAGDGSQLVEVARYAAVAVTNPEMLPDVDPKASLEVFRATIEASMVATNTAAKGGASSIWTAADLGWVAWITTWAMLFTGGEYTAVGATVPGTLNFDPVWKDIQKGGKGSGMTYQDAAKRLAKDIHKATTTSEFTGAYNNGLHIGPSPHVAKLE